jgi:hypothetical protein
MAKKAKKSTAKAKKPAKAKPKAKKAAAVKQAAPKKSSPKIAVARAAAGTRKFAMGEERIPKAWYNIIADLPVPPPPPLHPGTLARPLHRHSKAGHRYLSHVETDAAVSRNGA